MFFKIVTIKLFCRICLGVTYKQKSENSTKISGYFDTQDLSRGQHPSQTHPTLIWDPKKVLKHLKRLWTISREARHFFFGIICLGYMYRLYTCLTNPYMMNGE
uniref:Uncharacterized protein n=1 Tax=Cacopsylla melanoneura TaxID=428564 RepID=A0A8D9FCF8_9HEMI